MDRTAQNQSQDPADNDAYDPARDEDYEEVVEEYATSDEPDGTHRESHRITRTSHHPRTQGIPAESSAETYTDTAREVREPGTQTTTIRTVTRTETHPEAPAHTPRTRLFRRLSAYRGEKNLAAWEDRTSTPMFVASVLYLLAFAAPIMSTRIQEPYDGYAWRIVSFLAMIHLTANRQYKRLSELGMKLFGYTAIFIIMFALSIYSVESSEPGAMIRDLPTAYWWTFTTLATVGYGDVYPVTGIGRVIAVIVMLYGVGLVAVATGALASWIIEKIGGVEEQEHPATKADVDDLRLEIAELRALLAREYARRDNPAYTLREVVDEDGIRPVPAATDVPAAGRGGGSGAEGPSEEWAGFSRRAAADRADSGAETGRATGSEVAVREDVSEQEPVALLEETRQTFTIIREKFSFRSRK